MFWSCGPSLRPPSGPGARYMLRSPTEKGFIQTNGKMQNVRVPPPPPLRCNPNGNLALRGDKSYDLKRPSSVYVSLSRLKKGEEGCGGARSQIGRSRSQFDRFFSRWHKQKFWAEPHKPGHQGPAIPEIIKFLSSCFWHFMATHLFLLDITGPAVFGALVGNNISFSGSVSS